MRSIVFYVGRGAGADDSGYHQAGDLDGSATLVWHYQVIRLWQMQAEELLALGIPALLALVGQTRMERPETVLPMVVAHLRRVPDLERRGRLLTTLLALMQDEEMMVMVERLLDSDALLLDTPYLRRLREEGALTMRRQDILRALELRFGPDETIDPQMAQRLEQVSDEARLETLFAAAIRSDTIAAFQAVLDEGDQD